jgi:hypothetical protein
MKAGKHFIVVKKLPANTIDNNIVTEPFDIEEIAKTLGNIQVDLDATHVKYENDNVYLVIVCKEQSIRNPVGFSQAATTFR